MTDHPIIAWYPMDTAPAALHPPRDAEVLLLVKYGPTYHAEPGCRAEWSSTGWICTNSQAGGMDECEPLGWWPIPDIINPQFATDDEILRQIDKDLTETEDKTNLLLKQYNLPT